MPLDFKVFRFDPAVDRSPRYETYSLHVREGITVLEGLIHLRDYQDGSLTFRYSCRGAVCGSCAMRINGAITLACRTQIRSLRSEPILIEPLPNLKVIRDMVVDLEQFFEKYERVRPWLISHFPPPERERLMRAEDQEKIDPFVGCIMCAACYGACPVVARDEGFLGPAALAKVWRFIDDTRDEAEVDRLTEVDSRDGVWGCDTVFRCVDVCPKDVSPTTGIVRARRKIVRQRFKKLLTRS